MELIAGLAEEFEAHTGLKTCAEDLRPCTRCQRNCVLTAASLELLGRPDFLGQIHVICADCLRLRLVQMPSMLISTWSVAAALRGEKVEGN